MSIQKLFRFGENKDSTTNNLSENNICVPQSYPGRQQREPEYNGPASFHSSRQYIKEENREDRKLEELREAKFEAKERENDERMQKKIDAAHQEKMEQMKFAERLRNEALDKPKIERSFDIKPNARVNRNSYELLSDEEIAESWKITNDCAQNIQGEDSKFFIVILIDESKSCLKYKNNIVEGMNKLINNQTINRMDKTDTRMAILKFNESVNYLQKPTAQNLVEFIQSSDFNPNGSCKVFDGLHYALNMIEEKSNQTEKTLCVLFTLGDYGKSKCRSEELKFALRKIHSHRYLRLCVYTLKPDIWIKKIGLDQQNVGCYEPKRLNETFKLMDQLITQFKDYFSDENF